MSHHSHKGKEANRRTKKDVPLIDMSQQERDQVFSDIAAPLWIDELTKARRGEQDQVQIAALFWVPATDLDLFVIGEPPPESARLLIYDAEYGDGQGTLMILGICQEIRLAHLLLPGEELRVSLLEPVSFRRVDFTQRQIDAIAENDTEAGRIGPWEREG